MYRPQCGDAVLQSVKQQLREIHHDCEGCTVISNHPIDGSILQPPPIILVTMTTPPPTAATEMACSRMAGTNYTILKRTPRIGQYLAETIRSTRMPIIKSAAEPISNILRSNCQTNGNKCRFVVAQRPYSGSVGPSNLYLLYTRRICVPRCITTITTVNGESNCDNVPISAAPSLIDGQAPTPPFTARRITKMMWVSFAP